MAWETRKDSGGRYYTRTRRVGGRTVREYLGAAGSPTAEVAAAEDALRREARARQREDRRTQQERDAEAELPLDVLAAVGGALLAGTLVASGYRQHKRGEWRKRRARDE